MQRRGIGSALYRRLLALLRVQGYVNAFAGIAQPNAASVALHEAMGFRLIGIHRNVGYKLGAWRDVGWWQLALYEPPRRPVEPVAIGRLEDGAVEAILAGRAATI
jgi:phosphinothricin acetyltransferase